MKNRLIILLLLSFSFKNLIACCQPSYKKIIIKKAAITKPALTRTEHIETLQKNLNDLLTNKATSCIGRNRITGVEVNKDDILGNMHQFKPGSNKIYIRGESSYFMTESAVISYGCVIYYSNGKRRQRFYNIDELGNLCEYKIKSIGCCGS